MVKMSQGTVKTRHLTRHWFALPIVCPLLVICQVILHAAQRLLKNADQPTFLLVFIWNEVSFKSYILSKHIFFLLCHSQILQFRNLQYFPFSRMTPAGGRSMDELQILYRFDCS